MLANASVPLVGIVDTAVMGRMPEPAYIGATAIGATIFSSIFWIFGFLRMGTGGLIAQALGANNHTALQQTTQRSLLLGFALGVLIIILQLPIFAISHMAFEMSPELLALTYDYFSIRIFSAPATLMLYAILGTLVGVQKMRSLLLIELVLNISNVILTLVFFVEFGWGIKGVALASVISEYAALLLGLFILYPHVEFHISSFRVPSLYDFTEWRKLAAINGNLMIRTICLIAAFYWLTATSSRMGVVTLAANTLLIQMLHFMAYALDGFAHTAETLGGNAFGQKQRKIFTTYIQACCELGAIFAVLFSVVYLVLGPNILSLMSSLDSVTNTALIYLPWIIIAPVIAVWGFLLDGIFIGVTHTSVMRNSMIISLFVFIMASLILVPFIGNHGLWAAYLLLMLTRAVTLGWSFPAILNKMAYPKVPQPE